MLIFLGLEAVSESSGGWLVDDTFDFEASDFTSIFGSLALRIVEVSRNSNNSFGNFFAKESFGIGFDLGKHHSRNFFWGVFLAIHLDSYAITFFNDFVWGNIKVVLNFFIGELAADQTFDTINSIFRVSNTLTLGNLTN